MAGKSNTSATFFAQKKLLGKAHTSNLKVDGEEEIGSNVQSSTSLLFGEAIPNSPTRDLYVLQSASLGGPPTVEYIEFKLTVLTGTTYDADQAGGGGGDDVGESLQSSGPHTYKFVLPGEYELSSSNSRKGNGVFNDNQIVHQTLGSLQIIPPFYSQTAPNPYIVKLYQDDGGGGAGTEIPLLDNIDWNVDYYNGILFIQDYDSGKIPAFARCFAYVGKMASEVISSGSGGSGTPGGLDSYVQFNDGGTFGGDSGLVYNKTTDILTVTGGISSSITTLSDGTSYLVAGNNVTIMSSSSGQITISALVGGGSADRNKEVYILTASHAQNNDLFLSETDFSTSSYDPDLIDVYLNGVLLVSGTQTDILNDDADYCVTEISRLKFSFDLEPGDKLNVKTFVSGSGAGSASVDATYLTLTSNPNLNHERVLTEGNNITFTDTGANGTLTVATTAVSSSIQSYELTGTLPSNTSVDTVTLDTAIWDSNGYDVFINGVLQRSGSQSLHDVYRNSTNLRFGYELLSGDFIYIRKFS